MRKFFNPMIVAGAAIAVTACSDPTGVLQKNEDAAVEILNGCVLLSKDEDTENRNRGFRIACGKRGHATAIFNLDRQQLTVLPDVPENFTTGIGGLQGEFTLSPPASNQVKLTR